MKIRRKVSARLVLSPVADQLLENAKNKSEVINEAIEFYAHHGRWIQEDLQAIRKILEDLKGTLFQQPTHIVVDVPETENEKQITEEERELQEAITSTLFSIIGGNEN